MCVAKRCRAGSRRLDVSMMRDEENVLQQDVTSDVSKTRKDDDGMIEMFKTLNRGGPP